MVRGMVVFSHDRQLAHAGKHIILSLYKKVAEEFSLKLEPPSYISHIFSTQGCWADPHIYVNPFQFL